MTRPPLFFEVPAGTRPSTCKGCDAAIYWIKTASGANMPIDCDVEGGQEPSAPDVAPSFALPGRGISHHATCPQAERFRRPR